MLSLRGLLLGALLYQSVYADPTGSVQAKVLHVRADPPGAVVYIDTGIPNRLGLVNENLDISHLSLSDQNISVILGGEYDKDSRQVLTFHGYAPTLRYIEPAELNSSLQTGTITIPVTDSQPIQLKPAPGFSAALSRFLYWWQVHYLVTTIVAGLAGAGAFFLIAVVLPRRKAWLEERAKVAKFNARLRSLDVQNDLFLGRQFGEWATVKRLGAGGMAVVYKGVSVHTMNDDEAVAIKVMNPELAQDQDYRRRFSREVQISRTLDHPNVVRMIDFGEQDGILYLSMEYIQGETLRDMLPSKGLPLPEGMPIALGIAQGLIHAHQKGIVHRDLKPDNIMVTEGKLVKVMDLGLAKREESENVTRTGDTFGTPAYMAPEQITGGTLLPATDQYAFGVMLFELFSGRRPFEVADSLTLVMKHLQEPPPRIREYKSQLPDELESMIDRMLLKDPSKRYKSLVEVQIELTKIQRKYCGT
ncbi:serine/threonine protein kinase [bacterium]|nr:serine/threonine protein kinase [bacterium]